MKKNDLTITQQNEQKIITSLYNELKEHNFIISVDDGEEFHKDQSLPDVLDWHRNLDEMMLYVHNQDKENIGTVYLVFGNGSLGIYCLSDYSQKLEPLITKTDALIEKLMKEFDV